jgi:hypothetical protein
VVPLAVAGPEAEGRDPALAKGRSRRSRFSDASGFLASF